MMHTHRRAFSMLTAVVTIVMMASITALVMNTAGKVSKETATQYRHEQATLLAKSYTEYAILAIQGHGTVTTANACLRTITADINSLTPDANANGVNDGEGYHVEVKIQYIGLRNIGVADAQCLAVNSGHGSLGHQNTATDITTSDNLSATIDVYVSYHDLSLIGAMGSASADNPVPWITYHRRTLQRL